MLIYSNTQVVHHFVERLAKGRVLACITSPESGFFLSEKKINTSAFRVRQLSPVSHTFKICIGRSGAHLRGGRLEPGATR